MKLLDSLGKRIGVGYGIITFILIAAVLLTLYQVNNISKTHQRVKDLRIPTAEASLGALNGINHASAALRGWMLSGEENFKKERALAWQKEIGPSLQAIETLSKDWSNPENIKRFSDIRDKLKRFKSYQEEIEARAQAEDKRTIANHWLATKEAPIAGEIRDALSGMLGDQKRLRDSDFDQSHLKMEQLKTLEWGLLVIGTLLSLLFGILITRSTVGPLEEVLNLTNSVAAGHLDIDVRIKGTQEITAFGLALERLVTQIRDYRQKTYESNKRSHAIIKGSVDSIITIDENEVIESVHGTTVDMFGYSQEELIGSDIKKLISLPDIDSDKGSPQSKKSKKNVVTGRPCELKAQKKDGTTLPIYRIFSEVELEGSHIYVVFLIDITRYKKLESKILAKTESEKQKAEAAALKAEAANRTKSEFLANMSHELRTPLNSLLILAGELMDNDIGNLNAEQVGDATIIYESGKDLLCLINDILDLAKIESGKMSALVEEISLQEIADSIRSKFSHVAAGGGLALEINIDQTLPDIIRSDRLRIEQVLRNFISNALKFTAEGSVKLNIYLPESDLKLYDDKLDPSNMLAFSVTDTGIGIPANKTDQVFEAFMQADGTTTRKYGGTGLGLSISRELADLLGGEIHLESEENVGSTFTLYAQRALNEDQQLDEDGSISHTDAEKPLGLLQGIDIETPLDNPLMDDRDHINETDSIILIVDNDTRFAKIVRNKIKAKGHKCLVATDSISGLQLIEQYSPSAAILDIDLPGISGIEVYERVRLDPEARDLPIYFMSICDNAPVLSDDNAIGFLSKPISSEDLEDAFTEIEAVARTPIEHLMIIDDNEALRHSVSRVVQKRKIGITEAANGAEALKALKSEQPDCILLDLMMPEMDGITFLKRMAEDKTIPMPRVIVYSAKDVTDEEAEILTRYTESFIYKNNEPTEQIIGQMFAAINQAKARKYADELMRTQKETSPLNGEPKDLPAPAVEKAKLSYDFTGRKILITDDEPLNVFALSRILAVTNAQTYTAKNGQEAIDMLEKNPDISCVLMDVMMPVMNGYETIEAIRKMPHFSELPVIAVTAKAMQEDIEKCMEVGATSYIPKPIDKKALLADLAKALTQGA